MRVYTDRVESILMAMSGTRFHGHILRVTGVTTSTRKLWQDPSIVVGFGQLRNEPLRNCD